MHGQPLTSQLPGWIYLPQRVRCSRSSKCADRLLVVAQQAAESPASVAPTRFGICCARKVCTASVHTPRYLREDVIIWLATVPGSDRFEAPGTWELVHHHDLQLQHLGTTVVLHPVEVFTQLPAGLPAMQYCRNETPVPRRAKLGATRLAWEARYAATLCPGMYPVLYLSALVP